MSRFSQWYKRWRHGHGFGVHSPYAYRMVREVLRPSHDTGYYVYKEIAGKRRHHPTLISTAEAELIYRILVDLRPATVAICADTSTEFIAYIVRSALPHSAIVSSNKAEMLICCGMAAVEQAVSPKIAYFTDSKNPYLTLLWNSSTCGQLYRNPTRALIIRNPAVTKQNIEIKF